MATHCEDNRELLSALVDDELDGERRKLLASHVLTCEECSRATGGLLASRRLVEREACDAELPAGFHARLRARLDALDGVRARAHRSPVARRVAALVAVGAVAVLLAVVLSTNYFMRADSALTLARLHQDAADLAPIGIAPGAGPLSDVSCNPAAVPWVRAHRALLRIGDEVVAYTLFDVGGCRVSVFQGPAEWQAYRTGWLVSRSVDGLAVRQIGDESMTSWHQDGSTHVLVVLGSPEESVSFARAYMAQSGRSPGL